MSTSRKVLSKKHPDKRQAIIADRVPFEIVGCHEDTVHINEQAKFAFLVRISQMEELLAVLGNGHHGPQVHRLAPQRAFGTLRVLRPFEPNSTPPGRVTD